MSKATPPPTVKVTFLPHGATIDVPAGTSVIEAALEAGVHINASCGGEGVCGKCRVRIESGEVQGGVTERLSPADVTAGFRLACRAIPEADLTVRIPVESSMDAGVLNRPGSPRRAARIRRFNLSDLKQEGLFLPPVEKKYLELTPPSAGDNLPDLSRLIQHLQRVHDEHRLGVDLALIRKVPTVLRQGDFRVTATLVRPVRPDGRNRLINLQPGDTSGRSFAIVN